MKLAPLLTFILLGFSCLAQSYAPSGGGSPIIVAPDGTYLGNLNANPYDPNSVNNPYGPYGNPYNPNSIKNPYGPYGSPYSPTSVHNPYATEPPRIIYP